MREDEPDLIRTDEVVTAVIRGRVAMTELPAFFDVSFQRLLAVLDDQGVAPSGAAFARYHGAPTDVADLEVGFPVERAIQPADDVVPGVLPATRAAHALHRGGYDGLGEAWGALGGWIASQGLTPGDDLWEIYVTEPSPEMDPATLVTELFWQVADA